MPGPEPGRCGRPPALAPCATRETSTRCEPCAPREARSVASPARSARSAPITPTLKVTSSRFLPADGGDVEAREEPAQPAPPDLPLVAAISSRRCDSANSRRWIAQASRVSPGINTECSSASGLSRPAPSIAVASLIEHPSGQRHFFLAISARNSRSFALMARAFAGPMRISSFCRPNGLSSRCRS